jgi:hypothetical protein
VCPWRRIAPQHSGVGRADVMSYYRVQGPLKKLMPYGKLHGELGRKTYYAASMSRSYRNNEKNSYECREGESECTRPKGATLDIPGFLG